MLVIVGLARAGSPSGRGGLNPTCKPLNSKDQKSVASSQDRNLDWSITRAMRSHDSDEEDEDDDEPSSQGPRPKGVVPPTVPVL